MKEQSIKKTFMNIPTLLTPRLELRKISVWDAYDMFEYSHRALTTRYLMWESHPNLEHTKRYLSYLHEKYKAGEYYDWGITLRSSGKLIGTCGFSEIDFANSVAEVGYVISPDYWGRGYATEAAGTVITFGFEKLGFHRIQAKHIMGNDASARVMKKCGMTYEGVYRQSMLIRGIFRDIAVYSILSDEFKPHQP